MARDIEEWKCGTESRAGLAFVMLMLLYLGIRLMLDAGFGCIETCPQSDSTQDYMAVCFLGALLMLLVSIDLIVEVISCQDDAK